MKLRNVSSSPAPTGGDGPVDGRDRAGRAAPESAERKDPRLMQAARMYEKQFLREMVRAMRATVPESDLIERSQGERIFREQLDDQYVETWGDTGGVGLADVIYRQIEERFGSSVRMPPKKNFLRGMMPLNAATGSVRSRPTAEGLVIDMKADAHRMDESAASARIAGGTEGLADASAGGTRGSFGSQGVPVQAPLGGGILLAQGTYDEVMRWARIAHPDGVTSDLRFRGELSSDARLNVLIPEGTVLGWAQPNSNIQWSLTRRNPAETGPSGNP